MESPRERGGVRWQLFLSPFNGAEHQGPGSLGGLFRVKEETSQVIRLRVRGLPTPGTPWLLARHLLLTRTTRLLFPAPGLERACVRVCACVLVFMF